MRSKSILVLAITVLLAGSALAGTYSGGTGEPNNPYRIATPNDLNEIGSHPEDFNDCFILVNDINMAGFTYTTALIAPDTNSSSDGFQGTAFTGIFDGNDCNISNLTIDTAGADNDFLGLFGQIRFQTGEVKNLGIEDVNITGGDYSGFLGGLCGNNLGTISNCYATGFVTGGNKLGGLCGDNFGIISNCYATGFVTGDDHLGGLCGNNLGTISNCYATGFVTGGDYPGLLGGLCGYNRDGTISGCYFLNPTDGGGPDNGLGTALTLTQMKQQNSFLGWDFENVWDILEGQTYPFLRTVLLDPVELLVDLAQNVVDLDLPQGIENSLVAKLDSALKVLEDVNENNDGAAINSLEAFINAVEAQKGKKISEADADALIANVLEIIDLLIAE